MKLIRAFLAAIAFACPVAASAQAILQGGPWAPGHAPMYVGQGSTQPIVQDSGPAGGGAPGVGLSELGITARGIGTAPFSGQGTGPFGANLCDYDAPVTNSTGYHFLCFSANAQGGGLIAYGAGGTATPLPLQFSVNGVPVDLSAIPNPGGPNTWVGTQTFLAPPVFPNGNGYLRANGSSPSTFSPVINWPVRSVSANFAVSSTDGLIEVNAASGQVAASVTCNPGATGYLFSIAKTDTSSNLVTITDTGGALIGGFNQFLLGSQNQEQDAVCDGAKWVLK